jgi:hypothetical protein
MTGYSQNGDRRAVVGDGFQFRLTGGLAGCKRAGVTFARK